LRIIWHNFLLDIWHNGCSGSLIRKGRPFTASSTLFPPKTYGWNYLATRRKTAKDFVGGALNERQETAKSYQRGSRNPCPPNVVVTVKNSKNFFLVDGPARSMRTRKRRLYLENRSDWCARVPNIAERIRPDNSESITDLAPCDLGNYFALFLVR